MITATSGITLNHGWTGGYRFKPPGPVPSRPLPIEWAENTGESVLFVIDGNVEWIKAMWKPFYHMIKNGSIVDKGNLTIEITVDGVTETVVFEPEDEGFYSILVSNPIVINQHPSKSDNSMLADLGWKWNGEVFHQ